MKAVFFLSIPPDQLYAAAEEMVPRKLFHREQHIFLVVTHIVVYPRTVDEHVVRMDMAVASNSGFIQTIRSLTGAMETVRPYNDIANEHLLITIREKHGPDS